MDEDELLYREMNEEDPWYMGNRSDEDEGEDITDDEEVESTPDAFLLYWNPAESNYTWERYTADRDKMGPRFNMNWSINWPEQIHEGDKYYMIRVGQGQTGIVWYGTFNSEPYKDKDVNDKRRKCWYADIIVREAIKPDSSPLVTIDELHYEYPDVDWENMENGQMIAGDIAERLDEIISSNRFKESHTYKGYKSKEAYEENEKRSFRSNVIGCLCVLLFVVFVIMILLL